MEVLRKLAMRPVRGLRVTLISRTRTAIYSGMMPGHIAGRFSLSDISVNLDRLCALGGHRLLVAEIEGLDPIGGTFRLRGRPPVGFDSASVNVGVTPDLDTIPGAAAFATPVKPLEGFVRSFDGPGDPTARLCIIGGGAGGVELAMALSARFPKLSIDLLHRGTRLLPRFPTAAARWAQAELRARGVRLHLQQPALEVTATGVVTRSGFIEASSVLAVTLGTLLPQQSDIAQPMVDAMRHAVLGGGKRMRPLMACAACEAFSGSFKAALPAACGLEFIHAYSLIHDDLPAMDDDELRHGQAATHIAFGEANAILAGDSLHSLAFQSLAEAPDLSHAAKLRCISLLSMAAAMETPFA